MRFVVCVFCILTSVALADPSPPPKAPKVNDPALRIELLATVPEVEACTTIAGAPDGSVYVGSDPRDGRLNTKEPVCWVTRFSGVGRDRKRTVFADRLYSPAGSAWYDGWLYVTHDPFLSRFKDTNGDGVADVREDLVTQLGLVPYEGLNDHCVSGFTLGMDGFFYISVGDRGIYQAKSTKDGSTLTMQGGGIIRCRPDGTQLEIFSTGTRNHLSVNLDAEDNAFTRDNTDDGNGWWTRLTHHIEGGYYGYPYDYQAAPNFGVTLPSAQTLETFRLHGGMLNSPTVIDRRYNDERFLPAMTDFGGGSPTGGLCYLSDGLPESYRGKHFFTEWGKAGLFVTEVARDGATFRFVKDTKLVEPDKGGEFRPMQISVANDGSLLIADWGYGGWKSPRVAGAVWRLFWPEAKPAPRLQDESKASIEELIAALGHPDRDQRLRAENEYVKRALVELLPRRPSRDWQAAKMVGPLKKVMEDANSGTIQRMHAIGAMTQLAQEEASEFSKLAGQIGNGAAELSDLVRRLNSDHDATIRAAAARAPAHFFGPEPLINDPEPRVRLAVAAGLARRGEFPPQYVGLLGDSDPWVRFTARIGVREQLPSSIASKRAATVAAEALGSPNARVWEEGWMILPPALDAQNIRDSGGAKTSGYLESLGLKTVELLEPFLHDSTGATRAQAVVALGRIAYEPKPYDGHWWATQPVKTPPPLHSVPWSGTSKAVETLTAALSDSETSVRLAAAGAFSNFILGGQRSVVAETPPQQTDNKSTAAPPAPGIDGAMPSRALATLRARLVAETHPAVRRALIESLGVQKDPEAMDTFVKITLDRRGAIDSRKAALEAIMKIGGNLAQKTVSELVRTDIPDEIAFDLIAAVGRLKVVDAGELLKSRLHATDPAMRLACVKALAELGPKANATMALIEALSDNENKVREAAVQALGVVRDKAALPALIAFAGKDKLKKETLKTISNMADESAIPVLLTAIADKETGIRRDALKALKSMREKSWPLVEERLANGLVPPEFEAEIRNTFQTGPITKWKIIGPFENVWEAVHPPEADAVVAAVYDRRTPASDAAAPTVTDRRYSSLLAKQYQSAEGETVRWREVNADPETGRVNLENVFKTKAMVCAYAYAEIEAPEEADAKLLAGSNDQIAIWLNGSKVHNAANKRNFEADKDEVPVHLVAGKNYLFVKIGNVDGGWEFAIRMPGFENGKYIKMKEARPEEKQRAFALAKKLDGTWPGSARRGEKLFFEKDAPLSGICATCHAVGALGGQIGPNLSLIGTIYNRADLIASILEPSKTIALGFENAVVETKAGDTFAGVLRNESPEAVTVVGVDAQPHTVTKAEMKTLTRLPTSFMPQGLTLALKPEEFADLVAYLETLGRAK